RGDSKVRSAGGRKASRGGESLVPSTIIPMPPRVLIAEDDRVIANAMATHLRRAGMEVEVAENGDRAISKLRYERPDVAVIDLMLPGTDGWRITETLRSEGIETPIVIVSARGSEHDKVHALGIGGGHY